MRWMTLVAKGIVFEYGQLVVVQIRWTPIKLGRRLSEIPDSVADGIQLASFPLRCPYLGDIDGECFEFEDDGK